MWISKSIKKNKTIGVFIQNAGIAHEPEREFSFPESGQVDNRSELANKKHIQLKKLHSE